MNVDINSDIDVIDIGRQNDRLLEVDRHTYKRIMQKSLCNSHMQEFFFNYSLSSTKYFSKKNVTGVSQFL